VYQIGEDQALSCIEIGTSLGGKKEKDI